MTPTAAKELTVTDAHAQAYLKEAYLGEIRGEASFLTWAERLPECAEALNLLAEVESTTARYLQRHLVQAVSEVEQAQMVASGRDRAMEIAVPDWTSLVAASLPIVQAALEKFRAAESQAPAALVQVYEHFTAHEQALCDFFDCELDGGEGSSILQRYLDDTAAVMQ